MKKIYKESQLLEVNNIPSEVIESIKVTMDVLNENYGVDRNIESDLGGYVVIAENIVDIEILKQEKLQYLIPEYTDIIECSEGDKVNKIEHVAIYCRVSTIEQAEEGYSIDEQERLLRDWCNRMNYLVYKVYSDKGISGKDIKNR